jgi:hypothetical protein
MKNQYEQHYNAAALKALGVPVLKNVKKKRLDKITEWVESSGATSFDFQDTTAAAVAEAVRKGLAG